MNFRPAFIARLTLLIQSAFQAGFAGNFFRVLTFFLTVLHCKKLTNLAVSEIFVEQVFEKFTHFLFSRQEECIGRTRLCNHSLIDET